MSELHTAIQRALYLYLGGINGSEYVMDRRGMTDQIVACTFGYEVI